MKEDSIRFDEQVAIVTGAGAGLGRCHALGLAARGARVLVNDLSAPGRESAAALRVVEEIERQGGRAMAHGADVADQDQVQAMVDRVMQRWGRVDILINNAGILRDKSFAKMSMDDFRLVVNVHLMGSVYCTRVVWDIMREQRYGRVVMTSSSSGIFGNFGQSNYGAAKMGLVGLMNVLALEGEKYDIRVNTLAPIAATQMLDELITEEVARLLKPELVTPAVLYLASKAAPTRTILGAGAGGFSVTRICESQGMWLEPDRQTPEGIANHWEQLSNPEGQQALPAGSEHTLKFVRQAATAQGITLADASFGKPRVRS